MSVTHIQTNIIRLKNEVSNLSVKIADKRKRAALDMEKANKANVEALKTKSATIAKTKITESERYNKEAIKYNKEIAELEKNRASKEKLLMSEEQKLVKEQAKENRKITDLMQTVNMVQLEHSKLKEIYPLLSVPSEDAYDVFISHASEDKETFVDGLVDELMKRGVNVWYDRKILTWGKSIRQNIDYGLRQSKFAIIVLSEHYIQKYWTQKEFNALFSLGSQLGDFILPIWHNITPERANEFSPMLSDAIALKSSDYTQAEIADLFVEKLNYDNNG